MHTCTRTVQQHYSPGFTGGSWNLGSTQSLWTDGKRLSLRKREGKRGPRWPKTCKYWNWFSIFETEKSPSFHHALKINRSNTETNQVTRCFQVFWQGMVNIWARLYNLNISKLSSIVLQSSIEVYSVYVVLEYVLTNLEDNNEICFEHNEWTWLEPKNLSFHTLHGSGLWKVSQVCSTLLRLQESFLSRTCSNWTMWRRAVASPSMPSI